MSVTARHLSTDLCLVSHLLPDVSRPSLATRCASQVFLFLMCTQSVDYPADLRILPVFFSVLFLPVCLLSSMSIPCMAVQ